MNASDLASRLYDRARDDAELVAVEAISEPPWRPFWLLHEVFVGRFVDTTNGIARIDWAAAVAALDAGELPAPIREQNLLRLAASQAAGTPVSLRVCVVPRVIPPITLVDAARPDEEVGG